MASETLPPAPKSAEERQRWEEELTIYLERQSKLGSSAPTSGQWKRGDRVYNSVPTSGGFVGWVCTVAGIPGTWETFGVIS